jgi:hypothetical protein
MQTEKYIHTLLNKYKLVPSFPFDDWCENSVSFYSLINLWDELFSSAAGPSKGDYLAIGDVFQNENSRIYQVYSISSKKKLYISHDKVGGIFFFGESSVNPEDPSDEMSEKKFTYFEISTQITHEKLLAAYAMIKKFLQAPINDYDDVEQLDTEFVAQYAQYFGYPNHNPFAKTVTDN